MTISSSSIVIRPAHGWYPGSAMETDVISTIDSGAGAKWHTLVAIPNEGGSL